MPNSWVCVDANWCCEVDLHWRALELAERFSLPAVYDAPYLALAEGLGGEFWTADGALARTVQPAMPWVRLVHPVGNAGPRT